MKQTAVLIISSLLAILFGTLHLTDDIIRGFAPGGLSNVSVVLVVTIWLVISGSFCHTQRQR